MKVLFGLTALIAVSLFGSAYALESGTYFLDDSEFVSILLEIDNSGNPVFEEVFITTESTNEYIMNSNTAQVVRISEDHSYGKIFGKTLDGHYALVLYQIEGDEVILKAKVWTSPGSEKVVSNGEIFSLF